MISLIAALLIEAGLCTFSDMKVGKDIAHQFPGLFVVHHNKPEAFVAKHAHQEHHLIIPLRGESCLLVEGKEWRFGPSKMAYIAANTEHEFRSTNSKEGERLIAMIEPSIWKKLKGGKHHSTLIPTQQLCKELLFQLLIDTKNRATKEMIVCFASVLISSIEEGEALGSHMTIENMFDRVKDTRVLKAIKFIENNFSENLSISQLALNSGLSERNLTRLFVDEVGVAPKQALIRLRLEKARVLLRTQKKSVTEICFEVGYSSLSRFVQSYRSTFGRLPSEERL